MEQQEDELDNKKAADPGGGSAAWRAGLMVSQTGNLQGEAPLLSRPASGVVTTYCLIWVWSAAGLRICVGATVWCCAVLTGALTGALTAAVVERHIAAAVVPLPSSPDMANPEANAIALVTVRTAAHHLPFLGLRPLGRANTNSYQWAGYGQRREAGNVFIGHLFAGVRAAESSRRSSTNPPSSTSYTARVPRLRKR